MERTDVTESLNEWEIVVKNHHVQSANSSNSHHHHVQSDQSDSPPSSHGSLHVPPPSLPPESSSPEFQSQYQPSSEASTNNAVEGEAPSSGSGQKAGNKIANLLRPAILFLGSRVRYYVVSRSCFFSPALMTAVLGVVLLYSKLQRWRRWLKEENNLLARAIKEKDQKINGLLDQIALLKERLSVRFKVPVIQVR